MALKKESFFGKDALLEAKELRRRLVAILFDDIRQVPLGNEPIRIGGEIIGRVKSGGQGYSINKAIAYAYLPIEHSMSGIEVGVEFFGEWKIGVVATEPLFDPTSSRIRS